MGNEKYLFLLDVDKIQAYIFATNKLKTIIGASRLLDEINAGPAGDTLSLLSEPKYGFSNVGSADLAKKSPKFILSGGGNTKVVFEPHNGASAEKLARDFEARITTAYRRLGISVTTHIEPIPAVDSTGWNSLTRAEHALAQKKYGKISSEAIAASPYFKLCETCGQDYAKEKHGPTDDEVMMCSTCKAKFDNAKGDFRLFPRLKFETDVKEMKLDGDMLAVVVMDGNKMGEKIRRLGSLAKLKDFSAKTEEILAKAFTESLEKPFPEQYATKHFRSIRPIIIGGDDICFTVAAKHD